MQAEGDIAGDVRMHHQVLPGTLHQAQEEVASGHVLGRYVETRIARRGTLRGVSGYQRGLHRRGRDYLLLRLLQAFVEQSVALVIEHLVATVERLAGV